MSSAHSKHKLISLVILILLEGTVSVVMLQEVVVVGL